MVGHLDVLGIGLQILGGHHHHKADGALILEHLVGPAANGAHAFNGGDAIVGDQDPIDDPGAAKLLDKLLRGRYMEVPVLVAILAKASTP